MQIKFNPSGTQIRSRFLLIRLDIYPEPTDKTYVIHHVQVPDEASRQFQAGYKGKLDALGNPVDMDDFIKWLDRIPKIWRVNPCYCKFIRIEQDETIASLINYVKSMLDGATKSQLDNLLSNPDFVDSVDKIKHDAVKDQMASLMGDKIGIGAKLSVDIKDSIKVDGTWVHDPIVSLINTRLSTLEVLV